MIRNSDKVFHFEYYVLLALILSISSCAVGVINLIDTNKSLPKLNLSKEQQDVVEPKMMSIKVIVNKYELEKRDFDENANNIINKIRRKNLASDNSEDRAEYRQMIQPAPSKKNSLIKEKNISHQSKNTWMKLRLSLSKIKSLFLRKWSYQSWIHPKSLENNPGK